MLHDCDVIKLFSGWFRDGSGISWTIRKQSALWYRQITTPTPHHSIFTSWMLFLMLNQQCQSTGIPKYDSNFPHLHWHDSQITYTCRITNQLACSMKNVHSLDITSDLMNTGWPAVPLTVQFHLFWTRSMKIKRQLDNPIVHITVRYTHTHTHTHLAALFPGLPGWASTRKVYNLDFTEARESEWQWHELGHMQICTLLQTNNHASTPPLSFLQAGRPSCRPTNSVKALKEISLYVNCVFINICG